MTELWWSGPGSATLRVELGQSNTTSAHIVTSWPEVAKKTSFFLLFFYLLCFHIPHDISSTREVRIILKEFSISSIHETNNDGGVANSQRVGEGG